MFITIEGGEGSGKTSLSYQLWLRLKRWKEDAVYTREPGGTPIAEAIRNVIIDKYDEEMSIRTEVLLFAAARHEHLTRKIMPALAEGKIVVCDRFVDSSIVYQGMQSDSGGPEMVKWINRYIDEGVRPDLTFFLDIEPEAALERITRNKRETNRFDEKEIAFHQRVREHYLKLVEESPERYIRIDASKTEEEVLSAVWQELNRRREERNEKFTKNELTNNSTDFGRNADNIDTDLDDLCSE